MLYMYFMCCVQCYSGRVVVTETMWPAEAGNIYYLLPLTPGLDNDTLAGCQAHAGGLWARTVADDKVLKLGDAVEDGVHLKERPGGGDESHEK